MGKERNKEMEERFDYVGDVTAALWEHWLENKHGALADCGDAASLAEALVSSAWDDDAVTGNGSGSHTFSRDEARRRVAPNMALLAEACEELGVSDAAMGRKVLDEEWEWCDVAIRLHVLPLAAGAVAREAFAGEAGEEGGEA